MWWVYTQVYHLDKGDEKAIRTEQKLLKNNYFKFGDKIKQQISKTENGTKFSQPYACISMCDLETKFLEG